MLKGRELPSAGKGTLGGDEVPARSEGAGGEGETSLSILALYFPPGLGHHLHFFFPMTSLLRF